MKTGKIIFAALLAALFCFSFFGCSREIPRKVTQSVSSGYSESVLKPGEQPKSLCPVGETVGIAYGHPFPTEEASGELHHQIGFGCSVSTLKPGEHPESLSDGTAVGISYGYAIPVNESSED